jgi:o-succinylbenzoate---CoA ligase
VAFPESLKFESITSSLNEYNPTIISIVPTTLLRFNEKKIAPNKNLRYAFLGGGPAYDDVIINAGLLGWPIVKVYGSTETCSMVTALPIGEIEGRPSCAGKYFDGVILRIKNEELTIETPSLFKEYYKDEIETRNKIKNGEYFTRDFGWIDKDGYLYIESRREDIIISGGENISAKEIESVIKQNDSVEDTSVIPINDRKWGQIVCAVVQFKKGYEINKEELIAFLSCRIASYKVPKKFIFIDKIPRNEIGKINRKELLELIHK